MGFLTLREADSFDSGNGVCLPRCGNRLLADDSYQTAIDWNGSVVMNKPKKVAILTAGGLAPCLSSAVGSLIDRYTEIDPSVDIVCYRAGFKGLLLGDSYKITATL